MIQEGVRVGVDDITQYATRVIDGHIKITDNNFTSGLVSIEDEAVLGDSVLGTNTRVEINDAGSGGLHSIVRDNFFNSNAGDCITVIGGKRVIITGNQLRFPQFHGIVLDDAEDCIVTDNIVFRPSQDTTNTSDGIILTGNSLRNDILNNRVHGDTTTPKPRYAVNVSAATVLDTRIGTNSLGDPANYGTGQVNDTGVGTVYTDIALLSMWSGGTLTTGTGTFKLPLAQPGRIVDVIATVFTSPTGADLICDVNLSGTTIFTTQGNRPKVLDADADGIGAAAIPDVVDFVAGDYLQVDIDQIGSTVAGADLQVTVRVVY